MTYCSCVLSLRARLVLVAALAAITVIAVLVVMTSVVRGSLAQRLPAARANLVELTDALVKEGDSARLVARIDDGALGFCAADGRVFDDAAHEPGQSDTAPRPLHHDQLDALVAVCRKTAADGIARATELVHPHDIVTIQTRAVTPEKTAWALVRTGMVDASSERRWTVQIAILGGITLLLVVTASSAIVGLGRGVRDLQGALAMLRNDLHAPLAIPRAPEFASLTRGLGEMASFLADARDRERGLERDLAHRERLAGLGRVVAGVAHEIRNPLAGIKLKLDVMAREAETSPAQRIEIASCLEEVERLDRVVRTLLAVARKRDGTATVKRERIPLRALVAERIAFQERSAPSMRFAVRISEEATADADRDDVTRIVDNLLANAVEATVGNGHVEIALAEEGETFALRITDDGPGVSEAIDGRLFDPFVSTKEEGLGLGLFLSRTLAEANGGTLAFEGRSTFVLGLRNGASS